MPEPAGRRSEPRPPVVRRRLLAAIALVVVAAGAMAGVRALLADGPADGSRAAASAAVPTAAGTGPARTVAAARPKARRAARKAAKARLGPIPPAKPGVAAVLDAGSPTRRLVALTFDDGYCAACVDTLVRAVERTGAHVTFCPNGTYAAAWEPQRARIRRMLATGQVALCNHTFSHPDLTTLGAAQIREEIARNERWIERTFGVTARPFLRPPYGAYDPEVLDVAGAEGFTQIAMWSGTLADTDERSPAYLIDAIKTYAKPGAIILGHANRQPTADTFERLLGVLRGRKLHTATLPELLAAAQA